MTDEIVAELLAHNREHFSNLPEGHFAEVQESQDPDMVSICCSDSRVSQEGMFAIDRPGELFTPSNIGNQAWDVIPDKDEEGGRKVVNGNLLYPVRHTDTRTIAVVGHTGCGALTAAYHHATEGVEEPDGIQKYVDMLLPVVAEAIELNVVDPDGPDAINKLVEYNVDQQVAFLRESEDIPVDENVYGFVYDFQGIYGNEHGKLYLVNMNGERDTDILEEHVPSELHSHVKRLVDY